MIQVPRDTEGLRLVLGEMLEREHDLLRIAPQLEGKSVEQQAPFLRDVTRVTLSPGYERWAGHLMYLERLQGLGLALGELLAVEVEGLRVLRNTRNAHRAKHPTCYACGMPQENRFQAECLDCGAKFRKRGR